MASERFSQQAFLGVSALLFVGSAALAIVWCGSMAAMDGMAMPGGWTMSMAWMRMPGQTWPEAAVTFLGMWVVMMVAMMLPSLVPMLWRYRRAVARFAARDSDRLTRPTLGLLTLTVALGYFFVWVLLGAVVFPLGCAIAVIEMRVPSAAAFAPATAYLVILVAGTLQNTGWKERRLACCREIPACGSKLPEGLASGWGQGLRLGLRCSYCCAPLMAILLVVGVMDLRAMAVVTVATTAERLAPGSARVARIMGAVVIALGLMVLAKGAPPR